MYIYKLINILLEKMEFRNKTKLLISIIAFSMSIIGFLMLISIFALKYDYETLYQKRTIPQVGLEEIKDIYTVNIHDTLYDIKQNNIDTQSAIEVIELAQQIIKVQWDNYDASVNYRIGGMAEFANNWLNFFLPYAQNKIYNPHERGMQSKVQKKMHSIDIQLKIITKLFKKNQIKAANQPIEKVFLQINSINIYLSSLITSHFKSAISEKYKNDKIFKTSIYMLIMIIGLVFCLSIIISFILITHFRELHNSLEYKVNLKTKELRELNNSLEKRIKGEVKSSRKKDQIMFSQARLASLGEMLQNIAHQWRQPLGALTMIVQSFEAKFISGKLNKEFIESRVQDATLLAKNMSETLDDFRTFFDPNKTYNTFHVKKVLEKSIELSKYELEKLNINIYFTILEDITIYNFENELTHVVLNLINNAKDALKEKDTADKKIWFVVKTTQENLLINVIDNAGGIKEDIMSKIFDPYFTTKHKSVGTGIGLYMSKQIVEKHMHGRISCKNIKHKMGSEKFFDCAMFTIVIPKILDTTEETLI